MRIRLIADLPIGKEHGAVIGRAFDVIYKEKGRGARVFFMGDAGEECAAFSHEYDYVERPTKD